MKVLNLVATGLLFAAASSAAYGITIGGINMVATADSVLQSYGDFYDSTSSTSADIISSAQLAADLTDSNAATYAFSTTSSAFVDLGFNTPIYNGTGADLALFFVGDNASFNVVINGVTSTNPYTPTLTPTPTVVYTTQNCTSSSTHYDPVTQQCVYNLTVSLINLDDFGLSGSNTPITSFSVLLGDSSHPVLSLAGSMYAEQQFPTSVPLPLPALLFGSGLGVLGLFGRKRSLKS